jgi:BirA family transcriptional regulator, biotin operon repressor / biotin---[acetyl-CoA-carboxylase] ligase
MNKNEPNSTQLIGKNLIELDTIDSTNNYLSKLANKTIIENGSVILAHYQTQGKGQRGNNWESDKGKNLTFSIYLDTSFLKLSQNFLLSMMVCNSVYELMTIYTNNVSIKWPNDILIEGKKACGILIENSIQKTHLSKSVIGIGLNLFQQKFEENNMATSLQNNTSKKLEKNKILLELFAILNKNYHQLSKGNQLAIKNYYYQKLLGYKNEINYEWTSTNEPFVGEILEVEDTGIIKMRINQQEIKMIEMKEIRVVST